MKQGVRGTVEGRVQGVGFRDFTQRCAHELNLAGWVRNEPDGTVSFEAWGEQEHLEEFLKRLKKGPPASRVDRMEVDWLEGDFPCGDFRIRW